MVCLRRVGRLAAGLCLAILWSACSDTQPLGPDRAPASFEVARAGQGARRHVILLREGSAADLTAAVEQAGGKVLRSYGEIGALSVTGLGEAAVLALARRPEVEGINPDVTVRWIPPGRTQFRRLVRFAGPAVGPRTDQRSAFFFNVWQWNLRVIRADQAWLATNQGRGTLVCVLDSGIDPGHIDLQGKVDAGLSASFVSGEPALTDLAGHGTFVAGLISSNGLGIGSVAPDARLCSVKVLGGDGSGSFDDLIAGILYVARIRADVANMSLGAYFSRKEEGAKELLKALQRALDFASRRGVLLVAAAGNDGVDTNTDPKDFIAVPAEMDHVVSVGATAPVNQLDFDRIASYSNVGKSGVDVFAPGGDFVAGSVFQDLIIAPCSPSIADPDIGTCTPFDYLIGAGTSFAAPHVSGEGAVIESELRGNRDGDALAACILNTADPVTGRRIDPLYGRGRIEVLRGAACRSGGSRATLVGAPPR